jgi:hypothetical protein
VGELHPAPGSREATPSSRKEVLSDVAVHNARDGIKGGKKRRKKCPQGSMTMANCDDNNDGEAGGSGVGHVVTATYSNKHQAWPPTDHFRRFLVEACPNHAYPIRHKLKDYNMMKNFITSGSLMRDNEPEEDPSGTDVTPLPRADEVMMVYDGHPSHGRRHMSK